MTILQAILLGIVQGLTEFLPISSTAHLALVPWLLQWQLDPEVVFTFDVLVQLGTLLAVIVYFRVDIWRLSLAWLASIRERSLQGADRRLAWLVLLATLPGAAAGVFVKKLVADSLERPVSIATFLLATASFLLLAEVLARTKKNLETMNAADACWIGCAQAVALFPGMSRSGWTIGMGLIRGIDRASAARFSFVMSIPIMLGAGVFEVADLLSAPQLITYLPQIVAGFLVAAVTGFASIAWLLRYLRTKSLLVFAVYCSVVGVLILALNVVASV